jgi:tRNA-dihydrouridine synthase
MRTKEDKQSDPARWDLLKAVVNAVKIPVIANGDLYSREDVARVREGSGCAGVMLARPVLYNPSVLQTLGCGRPREEEEEDGIVSTSTSSLLSSPSSSTLLLPLIDVIRAYLRVCLQYESHVSNAKYVVLEMIVRRRHPDHVKPLLLPLEVPEGINVNTVSKAKTLQALAGLFGVVAEEEGGEEMGQGGRGVAMEGLHHYSDAYFGMVEEGAEQGGVGVPKRREGGDEAGGGEGCSKRHKSTRGPVVKMTATGTQ